MCPCSGGAVPGILQAVARPGEPVRWQQTPVRAGTRLLNPTIRTGAGLKHGYVRVRGAWQVKIRLKVCPTCRSAACANLAE